MSTSLSPDLHANCCTLAQAIADHAAAPEGTPVPHALMAAAPGGFNFAGLLAIFQGMPYAEILKSIEDIVTVVTGGTLPPVPAPVPAPAR